MNAPGAPADNALSPPGRVGGSDARAAHACRAAPLAWPAIGLALGVALDARYAVPNWLPIGLSAVLLGLAAVSAVRRRFGAALVGLTCVALGAQLYHDRVRLVSRDALERYAGPEGPIVRVRGTVASPPRIIDDTDYAFARWTQAGERTVFTLDGTSIEGMDGPIGVRGRVRVSVREAVLDLDPGDQVAVSGRLYSLRPPANPGMPDWALRDRRRGVTARLSVNYATHISHVGAAGPRAGATLLHRWGASMARVRAVLRDALIEDLPPRAEEDVGLLQAMVLGQRSAVGERLGEMFVRAGCAHFLAVSGAHLGALVLFAVMAGRLLLIPYRRTAWMLSVLVIAYASVAEPRYSIARAAVMAVVVYASVLAGGRARPLNTLCGVAALFILIYPPAVFVVSFQLSFAATCGIAVLMPALIVMERGVWLRVRYSRKLRARDPSGTVLERLHRFTRPNRVRAVTRWVMLPVAVSCAAWLATLPIVAWQFQRIQPWGALASMLVLPLAGVTVVLGFVAVGVALLSPTLAVPVKWLLAAWAHLMTGAVGVFANLPHATIDVPDVPGWLVAGVYGLLACVAWRFRAPRAYTWDRDERLVPVRPPPSRGATMGIAVCAGVCVAGYAAWVARSRPEPMLRATVLSVGRGSATVIELPDGRAMLFDAGTDAPFDIGASVIAPFLRRGGRSSVDTVFVSHPNLDHYGAVPGLVEALTRTGDPPGVGRIVVTPYFERSATPGSPARHFLDLARKSGWTLDVLDLRRRRWTEAGVTFELLWPSPDLDPSWRSNDTSIVLRLSYAGHALLLTGDVEDAPQRALVARGGLAADALVLPHHGSVRNSTEPFLRAVRPTTAIQSHRVPTARSRSPLPLILQDTTLYNTADVGAVEVAIDATGVRVRGFRQ